MQNYREEAEGLIKQNPSLLLKKINIIVWSSYLYFLFVIIGCILIVLSLIFFIVYSGRIIGYEIAIIFGLAYTVYGVIRSFLFSIPFHQGLRIKAKDYPELFSLISSLEKQLSVSVDKVFIDDSMNAGVIQIPKFGIFGGYQSYLTIGLQCLMFLSEKEFESVLAHELGHITNNHNKNMKGVQKVRIKWTYMAETFINTGKVGLKPIIWYLQKTWPKLNAYTMVYSRFCEYEADDFAVRYTSKKVFTEALVKIYISDSYLQDFWTTLLNSFSSLNKPPENLFQRLEEYIKKPILSDKVKQWVTQATFNQTQEYSTHPSLEDRLKAQGVSTELIDLYRVSEVATVSAAHIYLGVKYQVVLGHFNQERYHEYLKNWETIKKYHSDIETAINNEALDSNGINWEKIEALILRDGILSVEDIIDDILIKNHNDLKARARKAFILLEKNNYEGVVKLKELINEKHIQHIDVYQQLYTFFSKNNLRIESEALDKECQQEIQNNEQVNREMNTLDKKMKLSDHNLSDSVVSSIRVFAKNKNNIRFLQVIKRKLYSSPEKEMYLFGITTKGLFLSNSDIVKLVNELSLELSKIPNITYMIITFKGDNIKYLSDFNKFKSSTIYNFKDRMNYN